MKLQIGKTSVERSPMFLFHLVATDDWLWSLAFDWGGYSSWSCSRNMAFSYGFLASSHCSGWVPRTSNTSEREPGGSCILSLTWFWKVQNLASFILYWLKWSQTPPQVRGERSQTSSLKGRVSVLWHYVLGDFRLPDLSVLQCSQLAELFYRQMWSGLVPLRPPTGRSS
jgi:hypothetical protein